MTTNILAFPRPLIDPIKLENLHLELDGLINAAMLLEHAPETDAARFALNSAMARCSDDIRDMVNRNGLHNRHCVLITRLESLIEQDLFFVPPTVASFIEDILAEARRQITETG